MTSPARGAAPVALPGGIGGSALVGSVSAPPMASTALLSARAVRRAPALIAVAHGSRDPRSAATMRALVERIAAARPYAEVRLAFLDLSTPSVDQVVDSLAMDGHSHAVVAPLLLGSAFHARVDLPGLLAEARARHPRLRLTQADVLGPDARLIAALRDRVVEALPDAAVGLSGSASRNALLRFPYGLSPWRAPNRAVAEATAVARTPRDPSGRRIGIAVAAVGSSSGAANVRTAQVARQLTALTGWDTETCFATTAPTVVEAVARLRARGAEEVLVAPWFLAPGLLTDRLLVHAPDVVHTEVIGAHGALTEIVWDRYEAAAAMSLTLTA